MPKFPENCVKLKGCGRPGRGGEHASLPFRSANVWCCCQSADPGVVSAMAQNVLNFMQVFFWGGVENMKNCMLATPPTVIPDPPLSASGHQVFLTL